MPAAMATGCFLNFLQNSPIGVRSASFDFAMRGSTAVEVLIFLILRNLSFSLM